MSTAEAGSNSTHGAVQSLGHFFVGKILEVAEQYGKTKLRRQRGDGYSDGISDLLVRDIVFVRAFSGDGFSHPTLNLDCSVFRRRVVSMQVFTTMR